MKLNDALITNFSIADKEYDIDLSFNKVLDVFEILKEGELTNLEKAQLIVHLLTGQELYDIKEVVDCWVYIKEHFLEIEKETVQYDLLGNPMPKAKDEEEQEKMIDFEQDAEYIYASFLQAYGINLLNVQNKRLYLTYRVVLMVFVCFFSRVERNKPRQRSALVQECLTITSFVILLV